MRAGRSSTTIPYARIFRRLTAAMLMPVVSLLATASFAQPYPVHHPVAGGIAVIALYVDSDKDISAKFGRTPILVLKRKGSWFGVVGIDLETAQGNYLVTVALAEEDPVTREFSVQPYGHPLMTQRKHAAATAQLKPPNAWRPELDATFPLLPPVAVKTIVPFGTRYAAEKNSEPERSVVFRVSGKQAVAAPGEGIVVKVVETQDQGAFYITIDHGMGLFSCLGPVARALKQSGQTTAKGEIIGELDPEGTGVKVLYWKTALNGAAVDPLLFTEFSHERR